MEIIWGCDDGRKDMLRVAKILENYGFKGTFYIAPYETYMDLTVKDIQELSKKHIIGGHTLTHQRLTECSLEKARLEIEIGKKELEDIIGKKITKFAAPRGWQNKDIICLIKEAGFLESRTTKMGIVNITGDNIFELPCSAHFYPRPEYAEKGVLQSIKDKFIESETGGYFNLLMHTSELNRYGYWDDLKELVKFVRTRLDNKKPLR